MKNAAFSGIFISRGASALPAQGGSMHRAVPMLPDFIVQQGDGDRGAGHVEGGGVVAHHGAADDQALGLQQLGCAVVEQVQLHERGCGEAVDQE